MFVPMSRTINIMWSNITAFLKKFEFKSKISDIIFVEEYENRGL